MSSSSSLYRWYHRLYRCWIRIIGTILLEFHPLIPPSPLYPVLGRQKQLHVVVVLVRVVV
jgi:hypothetical protein